ncbi:uncharacterized protein LOC8276098 isoform X2 [Ricinus communis]|uniref:uncharacterized protein LOC8276098 isoform X2 n=1 Tax=Ricinus communis TaxID=3988 RepID=UPI00201A66A0|nr:uncharacterized protein LOC8276098 isoform X2 [Ricinus communis]
MKNTNKTKKIKNQEHQEMVHIRFMRSVLGLLFLLNALRGPYSYAHPHQDWKFEESKLVVDEDNVVSAQKGFLDGLSTTSARKIGFGGRKMVVHHEVMMGKEIEKADISGKENNGFVKDLQGSQDQYFNHQNMNNLKKSASLGTPKSEATVQLSNTSPNPKHTTQSSKKLPTKASLKSHSRSEKLLSDHHHHHHHHHQESQVTNPKGETQRLLEATKEIVNLMNKDYKGMDRPRRKPPINNHVPIH